MSEKEVENDDRAVSRRRTDRECDSSSAEELTQEKNKDKDEYSYSYSSNYYTDSEEEQVQIGPPPPTVERKNPRFTKRANSSPLTVKNQQPEVTRRCASSRRSIQSVSRQSCSDMSGLKQKAMKKQPLGDYELETYNQLLLELADDRKKAANQKKYTIARELNDAIKYVSEYQKKEMKLQAQQDAVVEWEEQANQFQEKFYQYDQETERLKEELNKRIEKQRNEIDKRHATEIIQFQRLWNSPAKTRIYNRPSGRLAFLKKQQNMLLIQCRFRDAEEVAKQIESLKKLEEDESHRLMLHDFDEAYSKLKTKQSSEIKHFNEEADLQRKNLTQRRERIRVGYINRQKKLLVKKELVNDSEKLWNAQLNQRIDYITSSMTTRSAMPSMKVTKEDVKDQESLVLELPPLKITDRQTQRLNRSLRK